MVDGPSPRTGGRGEVAVRLRWRPRCVGRGRRKGEELAEIDATRRGAESRRSRRGRLAPKGRGGDREPIPRLGSEGEGATAAGGGGEARWMSDAVEREEGGGSAGWGLAKPVRECDARRSGSGPNGRRVLAWRQQRGGERAHARSKGKAAISGGSKVQGTRRGAQGIAEKADGGGCGAPSRRERGKLAGNGVHSPEGAYTARNSLAMGATSSLGVMATRGTSEQSKGAGGYDKTGAERARQAVAGASSYGRLTSYRRV